MEGWVIAVVVILALLMLGISGLVGYLLYRPRHRRKQPKKGSMTPDEKVATKYPEPPENGDVKLTMPEDGNGTILPPYSPAKKDSIDDKPNDVKVNIESDSNEDEPEKNGLLKEVKVEPRERAVDVGQLEQKAPEGPDESSSSSSDDDKESKKDEKGSDKKPSGKSTSSSSSSDSDGDNVQSVAVLGDKPDSEQEGKRTKMPGASSSSSSSSSSDEDTVEPMPPLQPRIIRDEQPKESDDSDLVSDVLAAVDQPKEQKEQSSSSSSSGEDKKDTNALIVPVAARKRSPKDKRKSGSSTSSSSDEYDPTADVRKKPPKPRQRTKKPSDGKRNEKPSSSSSSSGEDDKTAPIVVTRDKKDKEKRMSSSSSSSSDGEKKIIPVVAAKDAEARKPSSSSSESDDDDTKKRRSELIVVKPKRHPGESSSSSSSGEDKVIVPVIVGKDKHAKKSSESSSSDSDSDEKAKRLGDDISTQTADIPPTRKRSKRKKKTKSTPPTSAKYPIATQTSKISSSSSSSESGGEADKIKRKKRRSSATSSSSSSSDNSIKRKQELYVSPVKAYDVTAKKAPESSSSSSDDVDLGIKGKAIPDITFISAWNRPAKLRDLYAAGLVPDETLTGLRKGTLPNKDAEIKLKPYLCGEQPVAGVLISETGEKLSIYDGWKRGLLKQETCMALLEAQVATGRIVDPKTGARYSVAEATKAGVVDKQLEAVLARDERAVCGYTTKSESDVLSLFEAMKRGHIPESHGIRLLEAQLATGGIIDPKVNHRLPLDVAYKRGLLDKKTSNMLDYPENRSEAGRDVARAYSDPNTGDNITYLELMGRCVKDADTGMRLLPLYARRSAWEDTEPKVFLNSA
ncbi:uncharacterized protein LOC120325800 [Styela clava]